MAFSQAHFDALREPPSCGPEEVFHIAAQNRSLTELRGIGPFIEKQIRQWLDKPPHSKQPVSAFARTSLHSLKRDSY